MKKTKFQQIAVLALIALLTITGCSLPASSIQFTQPVKAEVGLDSQVTNDIVADEATAPLTQGDILNALESRLSDIYAQVNPSVVSIRVVKQSSGDMQMQGFPFGTPSDPQGQPITGAGSGFVWDKAGHIVTNNHVVENADKITVQFSDGSTTSAEIVGTDPDSDLAVLIVDYDAAKLFPVTVNASSQVKVGQLSIAIGNPFGLDNTMTVGFISALGRSLPVDQGTMRGSSYTIPSIIQTDAPINPGNSGGVLVNSNGEVIGVTTAIISPVQASVGIGFAIPSDIVMQVVPVLVENGVYKHAWLGLSGLTLTSELADAMNLPDDVRGVVVGSVLADSPSEAAGLQAGNESFTLDGVDITIGGDVITALDNEPVHDFEDLVAILAVRRAGDDVTLTILRDGTEMKLNVTLGERPSSQPELTVSDEIVPDDTENRTPVRLGIFALTLNEDFAVAMNLDPDQTGVLVGDVMDGSPADEAGLLGSSESVTINDQEVMVGGDVITAWNGDPINDLSDLRSKLASTEGNDTVELTVIRDGEILTLTVTF
jgi:serine protease Do